MLIDFRLQPIMRVFELVQLQEGNLTCNAFQGLRTDVTHVEWYSRHFIQVLSDKRSAELNEILHLQEVSRYEYGDCGEGLQVWFLPLDELHQPLEYVYVTLHTDVNVFSRV